MEVDDIQTPKQACKYTTNTRVNSNAKIESSNIAAVGGAEDGSSGGSRAIVPTTTTTTNARADSNTLLGNGCVNMIVGSSNSRIGRQWQHSSRIIRVSRASGGKDRHSKVWTTKGPRDRRVRLSVATAIQFYDLQDRLGYDQPSKAVEWLIKAAADAINELPSLDTANFPPETPRQLSDSPLAGDPNQQQMEMGGSSSSNNSETGSGCRSGEGLSLSKKENTNKARERTSNDKDGDGERSRAIVNVNVNVNVVGPSFTQLLTAGISNSNEANTGGARSSGVGVSVGGGDGNQWLSSTPSTTSMADYFGTSGFSSRTAQNNPTSLPQVMTLTSFGGLDQIQHQHQHHQQQFPFLSSDQQHQHLMQSGGSGSGNDYNLNFTMSPATNSFNNRGTLQSNNSPSLLPYLRRLSPDASGLPFFLSSSASPTVDNHHQHFQPPGLQLCYGDEPRQADHKGKDNN